MKKYDLNTLLHYQHQLLYTYLLKDPKKHDRSSIKELEDVIHQIYIRAPGTENLYIFTILIAKPFGYCSRTDFSPGSWHIDTEKSLNPQRFNGFCFQYYWRYKLKQILALKAVRNIV